MGWFDDIQAGVQSGGQWLGDVMGAAPASDAGAAADEAHTANPTEESGSLWGLIVQGVGDLGRGLEEEGLEALVDPFGAMDRQDAQRDLRSRFDVGGPATGEQNNVSEEEFRDLARQYSDIRMGRSNLKLNTEGMSADDAAAFRERTMQDIGDIMQTDSGRGLIGELSEGALDDDGETHRITRIGRAAGVSDAAGGGSWDHAREHKEGHANYVPGEVHMPGNGDYRSDVTLYHELTHAYHSTNNSWDRSGLVGGDGIDADVDMSEYQAAGLGPHSGNLYSENAYRRDRMTLDSGIRTLHGSDYDLTERESYNVPGADSHAHSH